MNPRHRTSLVAGAATLLSTAPLATVFDKWTWAIDVVFAVAAVVGAAMLARQLRAPIWAQLVSMTAALTVMVTWFFGGGTALGGTIPTLATLRHWGTLVNSAGQDIRDLAVPVPDRQSLLFLAMAGVGLVAIVIDLCVVGLRRPALAGMAMLPLYSIPVMVHTDGVMFLSFAVAASGYLWLLGTDNVERVRRFGRRFTGDGRDVDMWEPSPLAAAGRRLAVVGVLAAILLPLAIPGLGGGLLGQFGVGVGGDGDGIGGGNGNGSSVSLFATLSGQLNAQQSFVMAKVTTTDPNPYYLRFGVADQVTPAGFGTRPVQHGQSLSNPLPDPTVTAAGVTQGSYHASVEIVDLTLGLLPVYTSLTKTQKVDGKWAYDPSSQVVYSNRTTTKGKKYSFDYVRTSYTQDALRSAPALGPDDPMVQQYTQVPAVDQIATLVNTLTADKATEYDQVRALYDYFSEANHFSYSLTAKHTTGTDDIVSFLNNKTGYCEQYAAALAWLVRQAHIPARVAFGFTRGSTKEGQTYQLTNNNLHAWTEVYFSGFGWVPFDATPPAHIGGSAPSAWAPDPNKPLDTPTTGPSGANPGAGASGGPGASTNPHDPDGPNGIGGGGAGLTKQASTWQWWVLGGAALIVVLLLLPALRRSSVRRRRLPVRSRRGSAPPPEVAAAGTMYVVDALGPEGEGARLAAHDAWDELLDTLVDYQVPVDPAETPRVTAARVVHRLRLTGPPEEAATLVAHAEERARYARTPVASRDLAASVRAIRRALGEHVSRRTRLRATLFPRSTLQRWRLRLNAGALAVNTAVGRTSDAVTRAFNPRRLFPNRSS